MQCEHTAHGTPHDVPAFATRGNLARGVTAVPRLNSARVGAMLEHNGRGCSVVEEQDQVQVRVHAHVQDLQRQREDQRERRALQVIVALIGVGALGIGYVVLRVL